MSLLSKVKSIITGKKERSPIIGEIAANALLDYMSRFYTKTLANPDEVLRYEAKGKGYDWYLTMLTRDPVLASLVESRVRTAAAKDWSINPFDDSEPAKDQAQFVEEMLADIPDFSSICEKILMSRWLGFSVAELIWQIDLDGTIRLADIKNRVNKNFAFGREGQLMRRKNATDFEAVDAEPDKFVVMQYNTIGENPYGTGLAQSCYWPWWFKNELTSMWLLATEKYGAPTLYAQQPSGLTDTEKADFDAAIASLMTNTSLTGTIGVDQIKMLEAVRQAGVPHESFVKYCDDQMARRVCGQTLTSNVGDNGGNRALGQVHADVKDDITQGDCESLASVLNRQVIKLIIDFNFGEQEGYPEFVMHYEPAKDLTAMSGWLKTLVDMGLDDIPKLWIHEQFTIPLPVDGEEVLTRPAAPTFPGFGQAPEDSVSPTDKKTPPDNNSPEKQPDDKKDMALSFAVKQGIEVFEENAEGYLPGLPPIKDAPPGQPKAKQPSSKITRYQIGSTAKIRNQFEAQLRRIYNGFAGALISEFGQDPDRMYLVMDDILANRFAKELAAPLTAANERAIRLAARELAQQLGQRFNDDLFRSITREYLRVHAYDRGVVTEMTQTLRQDLSGMIDNVIDQGGELGEMMGVLRKDFESMAEYKIKQIAVTETRAAANFAVLEMGKRSGMNLEAWFVVDPSSCPVCQEWASKNPYELQMAQNMGLPHPNCNDMWVMTRMAK